ncbi:amino acid ABC transporter permease [Pseudonocardia sp.]|jgi:glutamate transport system permease protein|uniref:amino acid ABC transporter permease n=1 Tax=Pseudonocardia sp. TaxID=60912 RepID=UPI002DB40CA2|nr:amino acid ABC transporter permease [Pseudonocardia sp.]
MSTSVLYDAPGPVTRRRTLISSGVASVIVLVVIALVIIRLASQGQFSAERWGPMVNPFDPSFLAVWRLLGQALVATLVAAGLTLVFSLVIGTLFAVSRITANRYYRWLVVGVIEFLRGVPVVIAIFFAARVLPEVGLDLPILWYLVIGLTAYNSVIIAEIIRAGVASLPRGQAEAGYSLGLTRGQVLSSILLPQAFRVMLPALISQLVVIVKDTSLGFIISYEEFVRTANIIIQTLHNPIQTYAIVALIFIVINYGLGKLAEYVERRLSRAKRTAAAPADPATLDTAATGGG